MKTLILVSLSSLLLLCNSQNADAGIGGTLEVTIQRKGWCTGDGTGCTIHGTIKIGKEANQIYVSFDKLDESFIGKEFGQFTFSQKDSNGILHKYLVKNQILRWVAHANAFLFTYEEITS